MRRAIIVLALGTALVSSACTNKPADTSGTPTTSAAATPSASAAANTDEVCASFEKLFGEDRMQTIGTRIGELIVYRQAGNTTQVTQTEERIRAELQKVSDEVAALATVATDSDAKERFGDVAANIVASKDLKFLAGVKKPEDLEKPLTTELATWVVPIAATCKL